MLHKYHMEILRTAQKDTEIITELSTNIFSILTEFGVGRYLYKYKNIINTVSESLYYGLTSLSKLQTLGEEHTGIIRVNKTKKSLPSDFVHVLWLLLHSCGDNVLQKILKSFHASVINNKEIVPEAKDELIFVITVFKTVIAPFLTQLNKVLFYFDGQYYGISERLTGINYLHVRYWMNENRPNFLFNLLGIVTLFNTLHTSYSNYQKCKAANPVSSIYPPLSSSNCSLCMENRTNSTITTCGHIFCWNCIYDWTTVKTECPLCRDQIVPSRNVLLQNYVR